MSVQNLFFPGCIFNNWQWKRASRCSSSSIIVIFHISSLLYLPQSEIRAANLLVDPGHLQEERVGGRYRRARPRYPVVDRALQKTDILLMTMAKSYLKQLTL